MTTTIDAIYEDGVLRPLQPLEGVPEHTRLRVSIDSEPSPHPLLKYCGTLPDPDAQEIQKVIETEFEKVDPDDWK